MESKRKQVVHILAGEIRLGVIPPKQAADKIDIQLSWSPKNYADETPPHGSQIEK